MRDAFWSFFTNGGGEGPAAGRGVEKGSEKWTRHVPNPAEPDITNVRRRRFGKAKRSGQSAGGESVRRCEPWKEAVEKLYKEMYPALRAYALRVMEDVALAEEAIQDAFCIACVRRDQFLSSPNPQGWIMLTLKHVMQNMLRTQAKLKTMLSLEAGEGEPAGPQELISVDLLFSDLSGSEDFRLLKRIALDRCTMLELAEELGISVEACKKRVQRARKRLQKKLKA